MTDDARSGHMELGDVSFLSMSDFTALDTSPSKTYQVPTAEGSKRRE